jgi:dihydrofolate reductase
MEDPGGAEGFVHGGWSMKFNDPVGMQNKLTETLEADTLLLGRVTYDGFAAAWPDMKDDAGFADKMNSMEKVVVSTTLTDPTWNNTTVISTDVVDQITQLKAKPGGPILVAGSSQLAQTLREHDLIDQYNLYVSPIVLGTGKRLFDEDTGTAQTLELVESTPLDTGAIWLVYRPNR